MEYCKRVDGSANVTCKGPSDNRRPLFPPSFSTLGISYPGILMYFTILFQIKLSGLRFRL